MKILFLFILCCYGNTPDPRETLIEAIIQVESGGNPAAVGDNGEAVGILQIHKVMVDDVNRILGRATFTYSDRQDQDKSRAMFKVYTDHYTPDWDPEKASRRWNCGPKGDKKSATAGYWKKVEKVLAGDLACIKHILVEAKCVRVLKTTIIRKQFLLMGRSFGITHRFCVGVCRIILIPKAL